ncbi:class I SAM-dependent methyltransferase [Bdellovibrio sp. SKB1291214]|uniref:class I SAM-dependent methyltransferase n=1 Tax=Bdellovibrio sp. SKB1291214 TaxID=1732569 RepID=UPI000B51B45C|nr:class I SAM-dependent methyltransferase [Bdellovibrio sp. SKB1291214]UYL07465.1 class I SAM-dependent methyltransferase [Bdellovibrio sp. SKB1291214]
MSTDALKQELFTVAPEKRKSAIRQDRTSFESNTCKMVFNDFECDVLNVNPFGCSVLMPEANGFAFRSAFGVHNTPVATLSFNGFKSQDIKLRWIDDETFDSDSGQQKLLTVFEVVGEPIQIQKIQTLQATTTIIQNQTEYAMALAELPAELKSIVYEMRDWLGKMKAQVDALEANTPKDSLKEAQEYRQTIAENLAKYLGQALPYAYSKIPALLAGLSDSQLKWVTKFMREQIGDYVYGAPFAARAYYKPRGYAGDYEMMNHLYRNELVGKTLFDQCMHKYFIDEPAGAAVKNRGTYLVEKISDIVREAPATQTMKILSIASGPAMEQQIFLQSKTEFHGRPLEFTCLDQDEESLKHAQRQLLSIERSTNSGYNFHFNNMAIKNLIAGGCPDQGYDLIYSAGLFDYFTEQIAQLAAKQMVAAVKPGGHVIIGNFSKTNPCVPFMELVLDWHLIYRSEEDLLRIFDGIGSQIWIEKEPLGVNLFVVIKK